MECKNPYAIYFFLLYNFVLKLVGTCIGGRERVREREREREKHELLPCRQQPEGDPDSLLQFIAQYRLGSGLTKPTLKETNRHLITTNAYYCSKING